MLLLVALATVFLSALGGVRGSACIHGTCMPGNEFCGTPFANAPSYHLMDQHGCGENDPNGPVFDPVHGVFHHFYQIHLAAAPGQGPDYGHFVSKDFVNWAAMPVAIWNGYDSSVTPFKKTPYDNEAIYTGSAIVVEGAGPGGVPGVVNIYPGLCNKHDWPACGTGTVLAQAVPADYAGDELLTNWTKPSYNPIMENASRDPSSPWQEPSGEWRLRTWDSVVYGSASSADMLAGKWYEIGVSKDFLACNCPSFYPLPAPTPGTEDQYAAEAAAGSLPTHVHKTSCVGDWWQVGTYTAAAPKVLGSFKATPGWEDLFTQRKIDQFPGFYASKDNVYPTKDGGKRRINWGWAMVPPDSTQTLPREITFNAEARVLQQYPVEELTALRGEAVYSKAGMEVEGEFDMGVPQGMAKQSEVVASFELPATAASFGITIGDGLPVSIAGGGSSLVCIVDYAPPTNATTHFYEVPVSCSNGTKEYKDTLRLTPSEKYVEVRAFSDATFVEAFFQQGRVAMVITTGLSYDTKLGLTATASVSTSVKVYPLKGIWVSPDDVRKAPRVYSYNKTSV